MTFWKRQNARGHRTARWLPGTWGGGEGCLGEVGFTMTKYFWVILYSLIVEVITQSHAFVKTHSTVEQEVNLLYVNYTSIFKKQKSPHESARFLTLIWI